MAGPAPDAALARVGLTAAELAPFAHGGTPTVRAAHAAVVSRALASGRRYVFLTGSPGIGKTTAIAQYLMESCHDEGFLFFYASPRKSVNRDIFEKFRAVLGAGNASSGTQGVRGAQAFEEADVPQGVRAGRASCGAPPAAPDAHGGAGAQVVPDDPQMGPMEQPDGARLPPAQPPQPQ